MAPAVLGVRSALLGQRYARLELKGQIRVVVVGWDWGTEEWAKSSTLLSCGAAFGTGSNDAAPLSRPVGSQDRVVARVRRGGHVRPRLAVFRPRYHSCHCRGRRCGRCRGNHQIVPLFRARTALGSAVAALIDNGASQPQKIRPGQAEPGRSGAVRSTRGGKLDGQIKMAKSFGLMRPPFDSTRLVICALPDEVAGEIKPAAIPAEAHITPPPGVMIDNRSGAMVRALGVAGIRNAGGADAGFVSRRTGFDRQGVDRVSAPTRKGAAGRGLPRRTRGGMGARHD